MSEKQFSYWAERDIHFKRTSLHGETTCFHFYEFPIVKPEKIRLDIAAASICVLVSETGAFTHYWNGRSRWLAKSLTDIFYKADNQFSLEFPNAGPCSFYLVEISADALKSHQTIHADLQFLMDRVAAAESVCLNPLPLIMDLEDRIILEDLRCFEGKPVPAGLVDAQCLLLFIRALEKRIRLGLKDGAESMPAYDQENLEQAAAEISADPGRKILIPELARQYRLSPSRFKSLFKQQFGLTVHQFILKVRMARASDLIIHTKLSVREIAAQLGYLNDSTFSASFKKKTGSGPAELRRSRTV